MSLLDIFQRGSDCEHNFLELPETREDNFTPSYVDDEYIFGVTYYNWTEECEHCAKTRVQTEAQFTKTAKEKIPDVPVGVNY